MNHWLPSPHMIVKEGVIVLGGAILAAIVISQFPSLRTWMKAQWANPSN